MSFLALISFASALSWLALRLRGRRVELKVAMRLGMGCGFVFTGIDHFLSAATRYVPMIPDPLQPYALELVYFTGAAELAGGLALLVPTSICLRLRLSHLQRVAGIALAVLLVCVVPANINVAIKGMTVQGLDFGAWYFWIRPLFQPVFVLWALYCVGAWPYDAQRQCNNLPSSETSSLGIKR